MGVTIPAYLGVEYDCREFCVDMSWYEKSDVGGCVLGGGVRTGALWYCKLCRLWLFYTLLTSTLLGVVTALIEFPQSADPFVAKHLGKKEYTNHPEKNQNRKKGRESGGCWHESAFNIPQATGFIYSHNRVRRKTLATTMDRGGVAVHLHCLL
jgi:hypothetical protein